MVALKEPQSPTLPSSPAPDRPIATKTQPGYLWRKVYVNAASLKVGTTFAGVVCEAAPAPWTLPEHIPAGNLFDIDLAGGGGAGAGANTNEGGSGPGGGGGARRRFRLSRADLVAMLPITWSIGLGGAAGLGGQTNNSVQTVTATPGGDATGTSAGTMTAGRGSGGQVNTGRHGGLGGGVADAPTPSSSTAVQVGGAPAVTGGAGGTYLDGAGHGLTSSSPNPGLQAVHGGASGGSVSSGAEASADGGRAVYGGGGGGSGRSTDLTLGSGGTGGVGGGRWTSAATTGGGGAGGPGTGGAGDPGPASNGADGDVERNGDGGGGGGSSDGNNTTFIAGKGGNGGFPGGGGGGGGATRIRIFSGRICIGGDGGKGGDGLAIVTALA